MTTTDPSQEPPGPRPTSARAAESEHTDGGGTDVAPASGRTRQPEAPAAAGPAWAPWALRAAAGVIAVLALAGIGTASLAHGSDGIPLRAASSLLSGGTDRWLSALSPPSPATPTRDPAPIASGHAQPEPAASNRNTRAAAEAPAPPDGGAPDAGDSDSGITPDGKVVINLANAEQLTRLPNVGPKRAQAILQLRARLKRFRRATDLLRVRGIGHKTLRRMLPHLVIDAPAAASAPNDAGADGATGGNREK